MLFERRKHLYSMKNSLRDAFRAAEASLFDEKAAEGCFSSGGCIPIRKNSSPRIIFPRRIHPYSEKFVAKDYFPETNASLFGGIRRQGLFSRDECISIRRNSSPGIIFPRRIHPYSEKFVARDYFSETDTSLFDEKSAEGCFSKGKCIPQGHESTLGMH